MKLKEEIRKEKIRCLERVVGKKGYEADYCAGASNALRWVLEELDTIYVGGYVDRIEKK